MVGTFKKVLLLLLLLLDGLAFGQGLQLQPTKFIANTASVSDDSLYFQQAERVSLLAQAAEQRLSGAANSAGPWVEPAVPASFTDEPLDVAELGEMRLQGRTDAKANYRSRGVFFTAMGATVINPVAGLVASTVVAAIPPHLEANTVSDPTLIKDPNYKEAFEKQAHRRKATSAIAGFGAGATLWGIICLATSMSLLSR